MARKITVVCPSAPDTKPTEPLSYTIEVITPLFGGGVQAGINDPITLIRPSSIRGHLRFWWRATRGAAFDDVKAMRQREAEIWGSTKYPIRVAIIVEILSKGEETKVGLFKSHTDENGRTKYDFKFNSDLPEYAAFPFRLQYDSNIPHQENNNLIQKVHRNVSFKLYLSYQDSIKVYHKLDQLPRHYCIRKWFPLKSINNEIIEAITAWVNFGGIGARTRRGFGALYCSELALHHNLDNYPKLATPSKWPTLYHDHKIIGPKDCTTKAWLDGIKIFQAFRQLSPIGRRTGTNPRKPKKLGRSNWPEAEAVRNLVFKQRSLTHAINMHNRDTIFLSPPLESGNELVYFPRAEYGLPIIFEIIKETLDDSDDNLKPTLQYDKDHDRLASPLIIRPIKFKDGSVCSLFLRLRTPLLPGAYLKQGESDLIHPEPIHSDQIRNIALSGYTNSPLGPPSPGESPRSSAGSALDAFFEFLRRG